MPRLGQHFLTDSSYLSRIVDAASITPGERVLEIGPGKGQLTEHLLDAGAEVTAIELDPGLAHLARERFEETGDRFVLIEGDAAQVEWPPFDKLVANLPYQISSPTVFRLLDHDFELAVLTVQLEFGKRLAAQPGSDDVSRLTIKTALRADAQLLFKIPPGAFSPPPEVHSACVRLMPREPPDVADTTLLEHLIDHAFTQRRKMLRSSLSDEPHAPDALEVLGLSTRRPGTLTPEDWVEIADAIHERREG